MSALGEVRGTQKQCHSRNGNCLATGSLLLNEMDELQCTGWWSHLFPFFQFFSFRKKKKRKKMENGLPQQYRWPWPSGWWSCCPCPESVKVIRQKKITANMEETSTQTSFSKASSLSSPKASWKMNKILTLLLSRIKDCVETIGLRAQ